MFAVSGHADLQGLTVEQQGVHPLVPQLRLDELLAELQVRLQSILTTRDRTHALLEAVVAIGGYLDLKVVLRRIIQAAVSLVDSRYSALGVIGEVIMPPTAERPQPVDLWLCGHHYRVCQVALASAGASVRHLPERADLAATALFDVADRSRATLSSRG